MNVFYVYFIFAFATALTAVYEIFWPLVRKARKENVRNEITANPVLSCFIFGVIQVILAPAMILVIFIPGLFEPMKNGLETEIMRENPDLI